MQNNAERQTLALYTDWLNTARTKQLPPEEEYNVWLILAGRGWGKTRTGAQDIALYALRNPNSLCAVVAPTFGDLRRVCFGGPSGLVSVIPDDCFMKLRGKKAYSSSISEITLYNGSKITGFAAIDPDRLRGPQFHRAWCDELAAWRYPEAFDQLNFGLRLGENPQCVITTTPKPIRIIRDLVERKDVVVTRGSTFENIENLAPSAVAALRERYEGTVLGRQELYAEIIDDIEGALWRISMIDETRLKESPKELKRIVVGIDPAVTSSETSDETGIVIAGVDEVGKFYVLDDVSGKMKPDVWARKAVQCYYKWDADRIIAETNNGGDLVERIIRLVDKNIPYTSVHASRGKVVRAEPISALYEQRKVHHVGLFPELEDQMCSFIGQKKPSPDRLDALVWAITHLLQSSGSATWRIS